MSSDDLHRVGLVWRLNRADFEADVTAGENLFHRASFIAQNQMAFSNRPEGFVSLARIYLALEEYDAAARAIEVLKSEFSHDDRANAFFAEPIRCFHISKNPASAGYKVIYDCQGSCQGKLMSATVGYYQSAVLGEGALLKDFEKNLSGKVMGDRLQFEVDFPKSYAQKDLAGHRVSFQVYLRVVMAPVMFDNGSIFQASDFGALENNYPIENTDLLRQANIHLYYMALRNAMRRGQSFPLQDVFMFINLLLKLGLVDEAKPVIEKLPQNPVVFSHLAHIFRINDEPRTALDYLDKIGLRQIGSDGEREQLIRAQALFDLKRFDESEAICNALGHRNNMSLQELRVQLAEVLALPVETYLEREEVLMDMKTSALSR
jgi:hypothetical protein